MFAKNQERIRSYSILNTALKARIKWLVTERRSQVCGFLIGFSIFKLDSCYKKINLQRIRFVYCNVKRRRSVENMQICRSKQIVRFVIDLPKINNTRHVELDTRQTLPLSNNVHKYLTVPAIAQSELTSSDSKTTHGNNKHA